MKNVIDNNQKLHHQESGAALVTVLLISVLLTIACIGMLSAVGKNSKNSTDVLSETKAYYAAESGLQATINALRNDTTVTYSYAAANPSLSAKLPYNYPTTGTADRVVIGQAAGTYNPNTGTAYSVQVSDPDSSSTGLTLQTAGGFLSYSVSGGATICNKPSASCIDSTIYIPSDTAATRTEISFIDIASNAVAFPTTTNPSLGSFVIEQVNGGVQITGTIKFRIDYRITVGTRSAVRSIWGEIKQASSTAPVLVTFLSQAYSLMGSTLELCSASTGGPGCADVTLTLTTTSESILYGYITPVQPFRLKVLSTGYGPNGAKKQLEGIIQRNLFNGLGSGAATTMLGTNATPPGGLPFLFVPGTSSGVEYSGGDCASATGCVPSFGLTDPLNLNYVNDHPPHGDPDQMQPPPAMLDTNNTPDWQQSPAALDALVDQLRTTAQNSGRYFVNPSGDQANFGVGSTQNPPGSHADGKGITFCEGSCKIGADGGGILVVTGKLTNVGGFSFTGLIIVTGEEGWERTGGGGPKPGIITGSIIIAPYNRRSYIPENLASTFLAPRYEISGGGGSDIIYSDIGTNIDDTSQVSDFMLGIAEK